jgi:hypothetical protein
MSLYSLKIPDKVRQNYNLIEDEHNDKKDSKNEEIQQCAFGILMNFIPTLLLTGVLYMLHKIIDSSIDKQTSPEKNKLLGSFGDNVNYLGDKAHSFASNASMSLIFVMIAIFSFYTMLKMVRIIRILSEKRSDKIVQSNESLFKEIQCELNQPIILENNQVSRLYRHLDVEQSTSKYLKFNLNEIDFTHINKYDTFDQEAILFNANVIDTISKSNIIDIYESIIENEKEMKRDEHEKRIQEAYNKYELYKGVD